MDFYYTYKNLLKELNSIIISKRDYLRIGYILSNSIWLINFSPNNRLALLKEIITSNIYEIYELETIIKKESETLFIYPQIQRKDYLNIYNNAKNIVNNYDEIKIKRTTNFKKVSLYRLIQIVKCFHELSFVKNIVWRLFLSCRYVSLLGLVESLDRFDTSNYKVCISFCDAHEQDNLISQYLKSKNIRTCTLQHGIYTYYENGNKNINCQLYDCFVSDYLLAWGDYTIKEFEKAGIDKERIIKLGPLKYISTPIPDNKIISDNTNKGVFGVVLDQEIYKNNNKKLIEIANKISQKYDIKYKIKMHPANILEDYIDIINELYLEEVCDRELDINTFSDMVDFSILHTTSVGIELIMLLSPVFRFKDEEYYRFYENEDDEFVNFNEFEEKYSKYMQNKHDWFLRMKKIRGNFMEYKNIEENYKNFFKKLID